MDKYILLEGEAHLLVAVFKYLKVYRARADANGTSVSDELSECTEDISVYASAINHAIANCLDGREHEVIARHYGLSPYTECSTLAEIGRSFNVTHERTRQVEARALQKIRRYATELTDEETLMTIDALEDAKIGLLAQANRAAWIGGTETADDHMSSYNAYTNIIRKISVQQQIRKGREGQEMSAQRQK